MGSEPEVDSHWPGCTPDQTNVEMEQVVTVLSRKSLETRWTDATENNLQPFMLQDRLIDDKYGAPGVQPPQTDLTTPYTFQTIETPGDISLPRQKILSCWQVSSVWSWAEFTQSTDTSTNCALTSHLVWD
ncbi:hypothetical protein UPYG_G00333390 [Umbra pygmaea]|uniref:Uncharacterized protein n=1 Tax=Umbra pygmaea TaxID=75934 RepID=A0ABD0VXH5_UMBPY